MDETTPLIEITGMTRSGKSTLAREIIMRRNRVIVGSPFNATSFPVEQFSSVSEAVGVLMKAQARTFRIGIRVQTPEHFRQLCQLAWVMAPCTLVLDETTLYIPNPMETPMEFKLICQAWAHAGDDHGDKRAVSVIAIGQRPFNLPPIFRAEVNTWYLFRLNSRRDRKLLEDDMGLTREKAESAGTLAPYHYMRVDRFGDVSHGQTSI